MAFEIDWDFIEKVRKKRNINPLTEKEKIRFIEEYKDYKEKIEEVVGNLEEVRKKGSKLEATLSHLKKNIPTTPHGKEICYNCDIKSVINLGRSPTRPEKALVGNDYYQCELCGNIYTF